MAAEKTTGPVGAVTLLHRATVGRHLSRRRFPGIVAVAARYALLAEQALADDRIEQARSYVAIGLQIDPENKNLRELHTLAARDKPGFWSALSSLLH